MSYKIRPSDIDGLPPELIKELSITPSDLKDFQIMNIVVRGGGVLSLDHILIHLYAETNVVHDRIKTSQRIYRMTTKDRLFRVAGEKAVYATEPPKQTEQEN